MILIVGTETTSAEVGVVPHLGCISSTVCSVAIHSQIGVPYGCSQAFDLPETESHGGLLGYDRQDLYISMGLQAAHGRQQESTTRVREGIDGTVAWEGEKVSIKCSKADDTVTAEVWKYFYQGRGHVELAKRQRSTHSLLQLSRIDQPRLPLGLEWNLVHLYI